MRSLVEIGYCEPRSAATTSVANPRLWRHLLSALGRALKRGILGKSYHDYMKQFIGGDAYRDRIIAAPENGKRKSVGNMADRSAEPEYEPVHGWNKRQFDDYMKRNPAYQSNYEAQLQECCGTAAPGVNGSPLHWFGRWSVHHPDCSRTL